MGTHQNLEYINSVSKYKQHYGYTSEFRIYKFSKQIQNYGYTSEFGIYKFSKQIQTKLWLHIIIWNM
jgi:hypothetical protein